MASRLLFRRLLRPLLRHASSPTITTTPLPLSIPSWAAAVPPRRSYSRGGTVNLILTERGAPKFETHESDDPPSKRVKWKTKKRLKLQRKREKRRRKEANRRDPRCIRPKGPKKGKHKFPDAEARIKYKLDKAKIKEAILVEKLKRYEVPNAQGPMVKSETLTGEERFYMKKMAQKGSNYVPVGRRGIFGGVILNMHLHWKKHETVKVICKPCKPGQVHEYAKDIARLSGGTPIQIIGDDTIIFYRGKNYVQPEVMSPIDTLSKKKALEKSKYEQSLETVRRFIAISEKELELYYRHVALYGDPNSRNSDLVYGDEKKVDCKLESIKRSVSMEEESSPSISEYTSTNLAETVDSDDDELTGTEVDFDDDELTGTEVDFDDDELTGTEVDSDDDPAEDGVYFVGEEPSETEVDSEDERNTSPM